MKMLEFNHVALHVRDVEASCRFYQQCLTLERLPRPDFSFPGAWFKLGPRQELHLIGKIEQGPEIRSRSDHFALLVDDIEAWAEHLSACGLAFEGPLVRPDRARQIFVQDPDGHYIELCTSPPA